MALTRGIEKAVEAVVEHVKTQAEKIAGKKEITEVATIAANNDPEIGEKLAEAMEKVGTDGVITVEEGKGSRPKSTSSRACSSTAATCRPHFVTDQDRMTSSSRTPTSSSTRRRSARPPS